MWVRNTTCQIRLQTSDFIPIAAIRAAKGEWAHPNEPSHPVARPVVLTYECCVQVLYNSTPLTPPLKTRKTGGGDVLGPKDGPHRDQHHP